MRDKDAQLQMLLDSNADTPDTKPHIDRLERAINAFYDADIVKRDARADVEAALTRDREADVLLVAARAELTAARDYAEWIEQLETEGPNQIEAEDVSVG